MNEVWKELDGFNGYYVSSLGRIKSPRGNILKGSKLKDGYLAVCIKQNGRFISKKIARLIAKTFVPNPDDKPCVDHINTIKSDNRAENLRWVTYKENAHNEITYKRILAEVMKPERIAKFCRAGIPLSEEHKKKIGLANKNNKGCGWRRRGVICVETGDFYESQLDAQQKTNIYASSIGKVCLGQRKTAGSFHWKFA